MASLLAVASNNATGSTPFLRTLCRYAVCAGVPTFSKAAKNKPVIDGHQWRCSYGMGGCDGWCKPIEQQ